MLDKHDIERRLQDPKFAVAILAALAGLGYALVQQFLSM